MTKEQKLKAAKLLRGYSCAIDNILYKHGGTPEDNLQKERDCDDLADLLEQEANDEMAKETH